MVVQGVVASPNPSCRCGGPTRSKAVGLNEHCRHSEKAQLGKQYLKTDPIMNQTSHAAEGLAALEHLRRMIRTAEDPENQVRCLDQAISEFRKIDAQSREAALSLVLNRQLAAEQFYLLRYLGVLTCSDNLEYKTYLRGFEEGIFRITHREQCDAARAMFGLSGSSE